MWSVCWPPRDAIRTFGNKTASQGGTRIGRDGQTVTDLVLRRLPPGQKSQSVSPPPPSLPPSFWGAAQPSFFHPGAPTVPFSLAAAWRLPTGSEGEERDETPPPDD